MTELAVLASRRRDGGRPSCHDDPFAREPAARGGTRWVCYAGCTYRRQSALRLWLLRNARHFGWA